MAIKSYTQDDLKDILAYEDTVLICCSSFESRWKSVLETCGTRKWKSIIVFRDLESSERENLEPNQTVINIFCKFHSPIDVLQESLEKLVPYLSEDESQSVLLDISTFTREMLLILLKIMEHFKILSKVRFIYTGSESMNEDWLSRGIKNIRSILGYSGEFELNSPSHLIVLAGFEIERAVATIEEYEPTSLTLMTASEKSSYSQNYYQRSQRLIESTKALYGGAASIKEIDISDIDALSDLLKSYITSEDLEGQNIVIVPLCNKLSTLAVGLVALELSNVQVVYPEPVEYNTENYSFPRDKFFLFER